MSDNSKQLSWLDLLNVLSMILQVESYEQNLKQTSNDDLLNELQKQDQEYLDKILDNQNKIINLLNDIVSKLTN
jgi:hypothetical protein